MDKPFDVAWLSSAGRDIQTRTIMVRPLAMVMNPVTSLLLR